MGERLKEGALDSPEEMGRKKAAAVLGTDRGEARPGPAARAHHTTGSSVPREQGQLQLPASEGESSHQLFPAGKPCFIELYSHRTPQVGKLP